MRSWFAGRLNAVCESSSRRPWTWFVATLVVTLPAVNSVRHLGLDTDLIRLLPRHSRASEATVRLDGVVGGTSYFAVILEGDDSALLQRAVLEAAARIEELEGVGSVEFTHPVDYIGRYRYLLIPSYYLQRIQDEVLDWQAEASPFVDTLEQRDETYADREDRKEIEDRLERYGSLPRFHTSADGRVYGIFVRPAQGATSLGATRRLFERLQAVARDVGAQPGVWAGVSGSMRNKIDEYEVIVGDLRRSGAIASTLILLTLLISFRSLGMALLPLYPLLVGLLWGFGLVPWTVGDLNTITAFLLLVVFGMGIDYSIHLLDRFRRELNSSAPEVALATTYRTTGTAVAVSGLSTALALMVLSVSDFRGFSEFGIVGGLAILAVLAAMYLVFPATLVLAQRAGIVRPAGRAAGWRGPVPGRAVGAGLLALSAAAALAAGWDLRFDYDFRNLRAEAQVPESEEAKRKQQQVYTTTRSPAAVFVAADLDSLDRALAAIERQRPVRDDTVGRVASLRDLAPLPAEAARRRVLIDEVREDVEGSWARRVENPQRRRWIDDLRAWTQPESDPRIGEIPAAMRAALVAHDGTERPLLAVYPAAERKDGRNAMAFTERLYDLQLPDGVDGPIGETPVFAEILWLVLAEGPWLVLATFLGVGLLVLVYQRSLSETAWVVLPLASGLALTLGVMAVAGIKLNFFNVVALPALLGLGVDDGVHYFRRWRELGGDTQATHAEMVGPLTVTSMTTMMGYSGMVFASHLGLYSIGLVACLGLALIWLTSLWLLPAFLNVVRPR